MLWIYINNQGNVECQVNVGNLIRQGNKIPLFVVLEGQNTEPQSMIWRLADVGYLKPSAKEFVYVYDGNDPIEATKTFQLNNPSQANSHFVGGQSYKGYEVWVTSDATNFPANGGHVGLSFLMKDTDNRGVFADTLAVYVEPTQGMHPITITAEDYATLLGLIAQRTAINLGNFDTFQDATAVLNDIRYPVGDEKLDDPMPLYVFTANGIPYFVFVGQDGENTTQTLAFVDQNGDLVYLRRTYRYAGGEWRWSLFEVSYSQPIKNMELTTDTSVHPNTHTMSFELLGSLERYSITWSDGVGIASITARETDQDGGYNIITVTLEDGRTSTFRVRNGSQGPVNLGNIGYTLTIVSNDPASGSYYQKLGLASSAIGHLVMIYPSGQARPEIYLVSDDPNSPYYYVTLGVSSDMVGHLIYSGVGAGGA